MPQSEVITVMEQFKRDLLTQEAGQLDAMTRAWLRVEQRLMPRIELLARELAEMKANGDVITQAKLFRLSRYQSLLNQFQVEWLRYQASAIDTITDAQRDLGRIGIAHAADVVQVSGVTATFTRLPVEAVENLVGLLGNGSPLQTLLLSNAVKAGAIDGLTTALLEGVALGINPRKVARRMADALAGGLNQALTTARTEQLRVYRQMNLQQYRASGVVESYRRLATKDDRVCPACLSRDGELIPLGREMDEHPNGRCAQVPVVIGIGSPQWQKGPDWFKNQPPEVQQNILGPGRYAAWKDNQFRFEDLATVRSSATWGGSLQTTPLADLVGN